MQGSQTIGTVTAAPPAGYTVQAIGDFDDDGFADLAITNSARDLQIMFAEPGGTFTTADVGTYRAGSRIVGAGDINGDKYDDVVFQNLTTGVVTIWLMRGHTVASAFTNTAPAGYSAVNIGDFDGDGRTDLLITSSANDLFLWLSQPGKTFISQEIGTVGVPIYPQGWSIVANQAH